MRLVFGILLILWGLFVVTSALMRGRPKDLSEAGWIGELTCPLTLIVGGGVLLWTSRKTSDAPKGNSSGRDRPPGAREVPRNTGASGGGTEPSEPSDQSRKAGPGTGGGPPGPAQ